MDKATRIKVAREINKNFSNGPIFSERDAKKLKKINKINTKGPVGTVASYDMYAVQRDDDLTILVWISANGVVHVQGQTW